jgi:hypothetical protein
MYKRKEFNTEVSKNLAEESSTVNIHMQSAEKEKDVKIVRWNQNYIVWLSAPSVIKLKELAQKREPLQLIVI